MLEALELLSNVVSKSYIETMTYLPQIITYMVVEKEMEKKGKAIMQAL